MKKFDSDSTASPVRRRSKRKAVQKVDDVANDDAERIQRKNTAGIEMRFNPDVIASPVRRRSTLAAVQKVDVANDDDAERIRRRTAAEIERRLTPLGSRNSTYSPITSKEQIVSLKEHFDTCLKLFTQNKITTKNAWNIHILDYMRSLVNSETDVPNMLQLASTSLDIGAKVYSLRVDDVYDEALKLANALTQVNILDNDEPHDDDDKEGKIPEKSKKIRRKKFEIESTKRLTITENVDTINGPVPKYNGLFTSSGMGENNLLNTNLLKMPGNQYELLVKNRSTNFYWSKGTRSEEQRNSQSIPIKLDPITTKSICPQFHGFAIDILDTNQEVGRLSRLEDTVHVNEKGFPIPDLDLPNCDANDDDIGIDDYDENIETIGHRGNTETAYVTDMKPCDEPSGCSLEYSYRRLPVINEEFNITGVWAGPSHWKLKSLRQKNTSDTVQKTTTQYKKTRTKPEPLDFSSCVLEDLIAEAMGSKDTVKKTIARKVVKNTLESRLLPESLHINHEDLFKLNLKKNYKVPKRSSSDTVENLNVSTYVYDNPNDNEYCNKTLVDVGWDAEGGNVSQDNDMDIELPLNQDDHDDSIHDDDLIAAPDMVPQNFVNYARRPKKMDMKRLKTAMWDEISQNTTKNLSHDEPKEEIATTSLSEVYKKLPNKIPTSMEENLSSPLAFVALLHLCNEHDLKLTSTSDLSDVKIEKE